MSKCATRYHTVRDSDSATALLRFPLVEFTREVGKMEDGPSAIAGEILPVVIEVPIAE